MTENNKISQKSKGGGKWKKILELKSLRLKSLTKK